ncbi:MAG TPA: group II intron reverse transcriptase/maturase [Woeseiaceae bacterium]|nr:group II intron reverse transcriptase/maturase [Woeseiaceae bacterium]
MTKQDPEAQARRARYRWAEACVWTDRMLAALENGVRGGKWFALIDKVYSRRTLQAAWQRVARNKGAAGVDRISVERFAGRAEHYLDEISQALVREDFAVSPVRRVFIAKGDGKQRPLGIPTVKDRVVQTALKLVLEPIFEKGFADESYGFRPGRSAKDALRRVDSLLKAGYTFVVDADLQSYFDTIDHERLMQEVERKVSDGRVLTLIRRYLKQEVLSDMEGWTPTRGTPQGAVLSPLLANIYLDPMDKRLRQAGYEMVRYADDFVVLCRSAAEAEAALGVIRAHCDAYGLTLHPEKTKLGNCLVPGQGFDFLGYHFEAGRRWVRKKSRDSMRDRIRAKTKRTCGRSLDQIIEELNPMLRGWFAYFKHANPYEFRQMDGFVRRRLRSVLRKQQKRPGHGATGRDHRQWPNAFFAAHGLFTCTQAYAGASQSR